MPPAYHNGGAQSLMIPVFSKSGQNQKPRIYVIYAGLLIGAIVSLFKEREVKLAGGGAGNRLTDAIRKSKLLNSAAFLCDPTNA